MVIDLTEAELRVLIQGLSVIPDGVTVFKGDTLHMLEKMPEFESLVDKLEVVWNQLEQAQQKDENGT